MDTGKLPLGTEVHLAIINPSYGKDKCWHCGHKLKKQPKYIYKKGYFVGIQIEDDILYHMCSYDDGFNSIDKVEPVGKHWLGDIIDAEGFFEGKPNEFDYYSKDIDIFDYGYEWDGNIVFKTEQEAKNWIKEFGIEE